MTRLLAVAVVTVVGVVACDSVPLTSPTGSTISVSVDQTTLPLNGRRGARSGHRVCRHGRAQRHTGTFSTTLGTFTSARGANRERRRDRRSSWPAPFRAPTTINAYSGGASTGSGNSSGGGVEVKIGAAAAGSLAVSVDTAKRLAERRHRHDLGAGARRRRTTRCRRVGPVHGDERRAERDDRAVATASGMARTTLTTTQTATVTAIALARRTAKS